MKQLLLQDTFYDLDLSHWLPWDPSDAEKNFCVPDKSLEDSLVWNKGKFASATPNAEDLTSTLYVFCRVIVPIQQ